MHDLSFDQRWTLFLDRDGVINRRIVGGYVKLWEEFMFLDGALEALRVFSGVFGRIVVVSNQQGIGKGLMALEDVLQINTRMVLEIEGQGGRIDKVYFSPHLEEKGHPDRKPGIGMALSAREDFPEIDFHRSVMVGDSPSDMKFGRNIGAVNVFIGQPDDLSVPENLYDLRYPSLLEFANNLKAISGT